MSARTNRPRTSAPRPFRIAVCAGLRTMLTRSTPSCRQIFTSIWPRLEAAAVWTRAVWPSMRMVPTMPSAVSGLTKQEAASFGVASSWTTRASAALARRYCAYIAPPSTATVLPTRCCASDPASITTPAPSLPTASDCPTRPATIRISCGGMRALKATSSPSPVILAAERSAGPMSSPRSDGLMGVASTRTRISSAPGLGIGTLARESSRSPSVVTSERSCSPRPWFPSAMVWLLARSCSRRARPCDRRSAPPPRRG